MKEFFHGCIISLRGGAKGKDKEAKRTHGLFHEVIILEEILLKEKTSERGRDTREM